MIDARVARWLFRLSRIAERTGWKDSALGRATAQWVARRFLRGPSNLPPSTLSFRLHGLDLAFPRDCAFVYARPDFERGTRRLLGELLQPGMTVADVGANVGYLTALMARAVGPSGKVYAVEPAPANVDILRHNVRTNRLDNVEVLPFACGTARRERVLYLRPNATLHSLHPGRDEDGLSEARVAERTLDDLVHEPVDLVKIDTEGAEIDVLEGMGQLLENCSSLHLIVEWNVPGLQRAHRAPNALPVWLRSRGFSVRVIDEATGEMLDVDPFLRRLRRGELPAGWFSNLYAVRR